MDEELRHYERLAAQGSDEAAAQVLIIRMRKGDLPRKNVEMMALLGDVAAIDAVGKPHVPTKLFRSLSQPGEGPGYGGPYLHTPGVGTGIASQSGRNAWLKGYTKKTSIFDYVWAICDRSPLTGLMLAIDVATGCQQFWRRTNPQAVIDFGNRFYNKKYIDPEMAIIASRALIDLVENIHADPEGDAVRSAAMIPLIAARIQGAASGPMIKAGDLSPIMDNRFYIIYAINYAASAWGRELRLDLPSAREIVLENACQQIIEHLLRPTFKINPDEEEIAKYRKLLTETTDFIDRDAYHRRLLEAQDITPSSNMAVLSSIVDACDETLKEHGYNFTGELGSGSHGYVYTSGPGEVTKVTRSPMEANIAQLLIGDPITCFPKIDSVEDITLLCESHMPIFAIRREHIYDFKGSKSLLLNIQWAMRPTWDNYGKRLDPDDNLTEDEYTKLEEFIRCTDAVKRKYRFIYTDIGASNLGTRADGSIVIRDFSHCAYIAD